MKRPAVKIYGERNTGTNYLSELLRLNLEVDELPGVAPRNVRKLQYILPGNELVRDIYFALTYPRNLGWKHSLVKPPAVVGRYRICSTPVSFVTLTKNPYSWLLSLYRRPYHQYFKRRPDLLSFLRSPWKAVGRENAPREISSPVELWNIKNLSYVQLGSRFPALNITYESLVDDPRLTLERISRMASCTWKQGPFKNVSQSTKRGGKDSEFYRRYYLQEKWKEDLSPEAIAIINERLSDEAMQHYGYERLNC